MSAAQNLGWRVEAAVAAPLWKALSYAAPDDLVPLIGPLCRMIAPLRGRRALAFALARPERGDVSGLRPIHDVLEAAGGPQMIPPALLNFYQRAAAHYHAPLGQMLAMSLPAGLGALGAAGRAAASQVAVARLAAKALDQPPELRGQAGELFDYLRQNGPTALPELRRLWPRATALVKGLESAGWLAVGQQPVCKDILGRPIGHEPAPERLSAEQEAAVAAIGAAARARRFEPFLLYGVTSSGKSEVYAQACRQALEQGRAALVLAPEIGLCLRLQGLLAQRLGAETVAVLHSGLSPAARRDQWARIAAGRARVVVGARSAVFAPLDDPGVICVDEEQDEAYKHEDGPRYHARDLALLRGQEQACPVVLGTATPALTTLARARNGGLTTLAMTSRVAGASLPKVEVVDLRSCGRLTAGFLSPRLHQALRQETAAGRQAVLFINRRGFAPALLCPACGKTVGCPHCSLALCLHLDPPRLICHACGHLARPPAQCPSCGADGAQMKPLGLGSEAVVQALARLEPQLRLARLDRDAAGSPAKLGEILRAMADRRLDVIVGTQMITKGHHFPGIGLVGVLLADQALGMPDFRAAERAYALLTQAAGRAGRGQDQGRVIIQTYDPAHHAVRAAASHKPEIFHDHELAERRALGYPPFCRITLLRLEAKDQAVAQQTALALGRELRAAQGDLAADIQTLGPAPAPLAKAKDHFRWQIMLKAPSAAAASRLLNLALHRLGPLPAGARLLVDVDPLNMA